MLQAKGLLRQSLLNWKDIDLTGVCKMDLNELYKLLKHKLQYMYEHNSENTSFEKMEFFAIYKAVCDLMQIKHIADGQ